MTTCQHLWFYWLPALPCLVFLPGLPELMFLSLPLLPWPPWLRNLPLTLILWLMCLASCQSAQIMLWLPWLPLVLGRYGYSNAPKELRSADVSYLVISNFILPLRRRFEGYPRAKGPCSVSPSHIMPDRNNTAPVNVNKSDILSKSFLFHQRMHYIFA